MSFYQINGTNVPNTGCQPPWKIDGIPNGGGVEKSIYGFAHWVCSQMQNAAQCRHRAFYALFDMLNVQSKIDRTFPNPYVTGNVNAAGITIGNGAVNIPFNGDWDITLGYFVIHGHSTFSGSLPLGNMRPRSISLRMTDGVVDLYQGNRLLTPQISESPFAVGGVTLNAEINTAISGNIINLLYTSDFEKPDYYRGFGFLYLESDCSDSDNIT